MTKVKKLFKNIYLELIKIFNNLKSLNVNGEIVITRNLTVNSHLNAMFDITHFT